jgi:hypothetical protein
MINAHFLLNFSAKIFKNHNIGFQIFCRFYGVRRYLNGSSMLLHVDRVASHVVSAILQIDQVLSNLQALPTRLGKFYLIFW